MAKIKFFTDSAADIPDDLLKSLDIEMIPFPIQVGDTEYMDRVSVSPEEFYEILDAEKQIPTHAQITPFQFGEFFYQAWKDGYTHIIYTAINSKASSTYQNAMQQANSFFFDHPAAKGKMEISVIDSKNYSLAYGFPVIEGAKMAQAGKPYEEIVAFIQDWVDHAKIVFVPYSLKYARKSGRVSAVATFVGEALGFKPFVTFTNGDSVVLAKVRGEKNVIDALIELVDEDRQEGAPYCILRTTLEGPEQQLIETCTDEFGEAPALSTQVGGVISVNAGPNCLGVAYRKVDKEDPQDDWKWDYEAFKGPPLKEGYIR